MNECSCCRLFGACYMCPVGWNRIELVTEHRGMSAINLSHMSHQTEAKPSHSSKIVLLPDRWVVAGIVSDHIRARCLTALLSLHTAICLLFICRLLCSSCAKL